ncbi:unnamed protein product [Linum trigynum]|uniref:Uncharacterized protein n=1 Tax=Linum trigynum TaxID=586398 RepID=A0AAV2E7Q5_9ROSI
MAEHQPQVPRRPRTTGFYSCPGTKDIQSPILYPALTGQECEVTPGMISMIKTDYQFKGARRKSPIIM